MSRPASRVFSTPWSPASSHSSLEDSVDPPFAPHSSSTGDKTARYSKINTMMDDGNLASEKEQKSSLRRRNLTLTAILTLSGGWLLAVILAIVHHIYLSHMSGKMVAKDIPVYEYGSQLWVKAGSIILVRAAVLALSLSAGSIVTQMAWRVARKHPWPLWALDHIFNLPSASSSISLTISSISLLLIPILFLVICIHALEVVTAIAPNALQVVETPPSSRQLNVTTLDLSKSPMLIFTDGNLDPVEPTASLAKLIQSVVTSGPRFSPQNVVEECTTGCYYEIQYTAPALQCRNLSTSELTLTINRDPDVGLINNATLYNATAVGHNFRVEWQEFTQVFPLFYGMGGGSGNLSAYSETLGQAGGVECQFYDALYSASMNFQGTSQEVQASIVKLNAPLVYSEDCHSSMLDDFNRNPDGFVIPPCYMTQENVEAIVEAFNSIISGTVVYSEQAIEHVPLTYPPLFEVTGSFNSTRYTATARLVYPDVSQAIVNMLADVTLGLISTRNDFTLANVTLSGGQSEWSYNPRVLWGAYAPALAIFAIFALYGIWCIRDVGAKDITLSEFLVALRATEIDRAYEQAVDRSALEAVRMQYDKKGHFEVVAKQEKP